MVAPDVTQICVFSPGGGGRRAPFVGVNAQGFEGTSPVAREEWNSTVDVYPEFKTIPNSRLGAHTLYESDSTLTVGSNKSLACKTGFSFNYPLRENVKSNKDHPTCAGLRSGRDKGYHAGLDMYIGNGVVLAPYDGVVTWSGVMQGYGKRLEILLDGVNLLVCFNHLVTRFVKQGDRVEAGTPIAKQGNTGCGSCGVHLHLEVVDTLPMPGHKVGLTPIGMYGGILSMHKAGVLCNPWFAFDFNDKVKK